MIQPDMVPVVDELLRGLDPRLTDEERTEALSLALADAPEFTLGALAQVLMDYHSRAEQAAGRPSGFYVDAMRARMIGGLSDDELLGYAVGAAAEGRPTLGHPGSDRWTGGDKRAVPIQRREGAPDLTPRTITPKLSAEPAFPRERRPKMGDPDYTVAHAAEDAAEASRRRTEQEIMRMTGVGQGQQYPGMPSRAEAERLTTEAMNPDAQRLLDRLQAQRMDEAAIDVADLDDQVQARAAIAASRVLDPEQTSDGPNNDLGGIGTQPTPCGHPTTKGPCMLRSGHPVMPVPGTENGHIGINEE